MRELRKFKVGDRVRVVRNIVRDTNQTKTLTSPYEGIITNIGSLINEDKYAEFNFNENAWCFLDALELIEPGIISGSCDTRGYGTLAIGTSNFQEIMDNFAYRYWGTSCHNGVDTTFWGDKTLTNKKQTIMNKITSFVKKSLLSSDEKLLRKFGFKDESGEYTEAGQEFAIKDLCYEKEASMIVVAKEMEGEEKVK